MGTWTWRSLVQRRRLRAWWTSLRHVHPIWLKIRGWMIPPFVLSLSNHIGSFDELRASGFKICAHQNGCTLEVSVPIISVQPSTNTNTISLNGSEIIIGDSIIMPIAISTLATTRSMTRKGTKIMKPS